MEATGIVLKHRIIVRRGGEMGEVPRREYLNYMGLAGRAANVFWIVYRMTLFIKIHDTRRSVYSTLPPPAQEKSMRVNKVAKRTDKNDIYCKH